MFARHSSMPRHSPGHYLPLIENPTDWTPQICSRTAAYRTIKGSLKLTEYSDSELRILGPRTSDMSHPPLHLLGEEMVLERAFSWYQDRALQGGLRRCPRQVEWTRFILRRGRVILDQAGIYQAVFLSLFWYGWDASLFRAFTERWNYVSNTVLVEDREMSLTLWELRQLSGLPILGSPYEEYSPSNEALLSSSPDGSPYPESLRRVYRVYSELLRNRGHVSFECWVHHFTDRVERPCERFPVPFDPWGTGAANIYDRECRPGLESITSRDFDDETLLTAFLSWWLCYFVIPSYPSGRIRPDTFSMASLLARGHRVSLAIPALANIYRSLRALVTSRDPSFCDVVIPLHFVCAWLHAHWSGLYNPSMSQGMRSQLPLLAEIAGSAMALLSPTDARFLFFHSRAALRPFHGRILVRDMPRDADSFLIDTSLTRLERVSVARLAEVEFLISIRYSLLPLRLGDHIILEPYMPNRCAHQFGFD